MNCAGIGPSARIVGRKGVHDLGLCTGCRTDLFYSHRKEGPKTGRNLAAVALDPRSNGRGSVT